MPHVFALSAPDLGRPRGGGGGGHHGGRGHWRGRGGGSYYYGGGPSYYYPDAYYDAGPCGCPNTYEPVVGTDDRMYRNACTAMCYGVRVRGLSGPPSSLVAPLAGATEFFAKFGPVVGGVMVFGLSVGTGLVLTSLLAKALGK